MAKLTLTKAFTMPTEQVLDGMEKIAEELNKEHGMKYAWVSDHKVEFSHKAGKGYLAIEGEQLVLNLKISMLYAAMAPVVKKRVNEFADKYIQ